MAALHSDEEHLFGDGGNISSSSDAIPRHALIDPVRSLSQRTASTSTALSPEPVSFLSSATHSGIELTSGNNPVAIALHICNRDVIRPYKKLLLVVGWQPLFDDPTACCHHVVNWLLPLAVVLLVVFGYIVQCASCFKRDNPFMIYQREDNSSGVHLNENKCRNHIVSDYVIPDLLHSLAYAYSFYLLRFHEREHLPTLMERVFLQTSQTQTGFLSQGRLIRTMRAMLYVCVSWVLLSLISLIIRVRALYSTIDFDWLDISSDVGRISLLVLMLLSFVALDVVYSAVVINYCVQCVLLIFYIEGLQEKIKQCDILLKNAIREMLEIEKRLYHLNYNTAVALSIILFNLAAMTLLSLVSLSIPSPWNSLIFTSAIVDTILWISMLSLPIIQAARLSASCNSLRKIGHEIRVRPFGYSDISDQDMDGFLLYTSTLNMRAMLFFVPVHARYLFGGTVVISFVFLVLFQSGVLPFT